MYAIKSSLVEQIYTIKRSLAKGSLGGQNMC